MKKKALYIHKPQDYTIPMDMYAGSACINLFDTMGVVPQQKVHLARLTERFLGVFPESRAEFKGERPANTANRPLQVSRREILAVADGLVALFRKPDAPFSGLQKIAKKWQIWGYIEEVLDPESAPEFEGELDNAPEPISADFAADVD